MRKNLGVWRGWKLGECFSGDMETSGCRFSSVETCHSCTLETFGVHSRYVETSVAFVCLVELRARSVVGCGRSVVIFFSAFRGTRWLLWCYRNFRFKVCLHIPLGWWGAFGNAA